MSKILKMVFLSLLLAVGLNASDFLSKATGGALSDSLVGVKQLNQEQMKQVVGGYDFYRLPELDSSSTLAFLVTDDNGNLPYNLYASGALQYRTVLIAKLRFNYGSRPTRYLQVYRADKSHTEYAGIGYGQILDEFTRYTSN